jgi:hypothetical protein
MERTMVKFALGHLGVVFALISNAADSLKAF